MEAWGSASGTNLDGHAGAVEGKGEETSLALQPLVANSKLSERTSVVSCQCQTVVRTHNIPQPVGGRRGGSGHRGGVGVAIGERWEWQQGGSGSRGRGGSSNRGRGGSGNRGEVGVATAERWEWQQGERWEWQQGRGGSGNRGRGKV